MSHSSEEDNIASPSSQSNANKKRRVQNQRACDRCRQKKIRCDGTPSSSKCSHCISSGSECIFTESTKTRGPPKRYVDSLETRLEKMEGMLSRLYPDGDFSQEMELDGWARSFQPESPESQASPKVAPSSKDSSPLQPHLPSPKTPGGYSDDSAYDSDTDTSGEQDDVVHHLRKLCLTPNPRRYFGKSSGVSLLRSVMSAKSKATNAESPGVDPETRIHRRHDFWNLRPWERDRVRSVQRDYEFPEPDLLANLIAIYFTNLAPMLPLLHRPTFMKAFNNGLHLQDNKFGAIVLLVCATASRYSDDPRTLLDGGHLHSAGWKWFNQVEPFTNNVLSGPELYDLQVAALAGIYIHGTLPPHEAWIFVGIGLRLAQDVGAHRRRSHHGRPTVEDELVKRAFWVLLMFDIWTSSYLGRPCAISEENHDVDLPVECDDEYWENDDPSLAFKQPPGKPSQVSYFNHLIKISLLHSHALRTIYSLNKYRLVMGPREKGWEELTVTSLDSALNSWFDSIPDHLRWDPEREDRTFFVQSAALRAAFYFIQITIHRPFIPSVRKESSLSFPALAICASAARACSHVTDALRKRYPASTTPNILLPAFVAGVILLMSLWGAKRTGTSPDPEREMQDVRKCMKLLECAESRWPVAGRLRDVLTDLTAAGDLTVPADSPPSNKREREDSDDESPQLRSTSQAQTPRLHQPMSISSATYPPLAKVEFDNATLSVSAGPRDESTKLPIVSTISSAVPFAAVKHEVQPVMFGQSVPPAPAPTEKVDPMLVPQPYRGSYVPLGGSSGLGRASPAMEPSAPVSAPEFASFGSTPPPSATAAFTTPPTMYGNSNRTLPSSTAFGGAPLSGMSVFPGTNGLYDYSTSTPPLASASVSSSASSPQNGFQPVPDFNADASDGVFDMTGMNMAFGGYGVPVAEKEAMLRHFAPALHQDGQIGVDRDTMMMWSTMPSSYETQDWETYLMNMLGLSNTNAVDPGTGMDARGVGRFS
ncbi:fungal-specific transcription factor domain-containing protein [Russula earlei]|uniref:Fungal-specific transcription factor domain-containing protein n=1 Tax=Russula earlei TaxID=71964 RepID=A0ACC0ULG8_9AGAM|nr:fungal-specific transcription factor domain-containing protein [Russula earlei]